MHRTAASMWKVSVASLAALLVGAASSGPDYWVGMGPGSANTPPPSPLISAAIRIAGK